MILISNKKFKTNLEGLVHKVRLKYKHKVWTKIKVLKTNVQVRKVIQQSKKNKLLFQLVMGINKKIKLRNHLFQFQVVQA